MYGLHRPALSIKDASKFDRVFPPRHHKLSMTWLCIKSDGLALNMASLHFQYDLKTPVENQKFLNSHFLPVTAWLEICIGIIEHPGFYYGLELPLNGKKNFQSWLKMVGVMCFLELLEK